MKCMIYQEDINSKIDSERERKSNKSISIKDKQAQRSTFKNISKPRYFVSTVYNFQRINTMATLYYSKYSRAQGGKKGGNLLNSSYKARLTIIAKPDKDSTKK